MISTAIPNVLIGGAEPGGNLAAGLAVADELRSDFGHGCIVFVGVGDGSIAQRVMDAGFGYRDLVAAAGISHRRGPFRPFRPRLRCSELIRELRPSAVVTLGGDSGVRLGQVAASHGVPLVVVEANPELTPATRRLAPLANLVCLAFEETRAQLRSISPVRVVGIPRGASARSVEANGEALPGLLHLLIFGEGPERCGINSVLPRALIQLRSRLTSWRIVHRAQADEVPAVRRVYRRGGLDAAVTAHIHKLPALLARAELVIAPAAPVSNQEWSGTAAPLVIAAPARWHGFRRLLYGKPSGRPATRCVVDGVLREEAWIKALEPLLTSPERRRRLSEQLRRPSRPDAAWQVASMVRDLAVAASR